MSPFLFFFFSFEALFGFGFLELGGNRVGLVDQATRKKLQLLSLFVSTRDLVVLSICYYQGETEINKNDAKLPCGHDEPLGQRTRRRGQEGSSSADGRFASRDPERPRREQDKEGGD